MGYAVIITRSKETTETQGVTSIRPHLSRRNYSNGVIDAGNGKIYVPEAVMKNDVAYTVNVSR